MANIQTGNPWTFDSVMSAPYKAYVKIRDMVWGSQVALGDRLIILDQAGNTIVDIVASGPNQIERLGKLDWTNGFQITRIDSGKVIVAI